MMLSFIVLTELDLPNLSAFQNQHRVLEFVGNLKDGVFWLLPFIHMWTILLGLPTVISLLGEQTVLRLHHLQPIKMKL